MENIINIDGLSVCYSDSGKKDGDPVVLMHGWGCNRSTVKVIEDSLTDTHRVVNIDLPGHGKSQEPPGPWGVEEFATLVEKIIKRLGLLKPSLIGHSFGGRVAIIVASHNDIKKLVLVDSAGIKPKRSLKYYFKVYRFKLTKRLVLLAWGREKGNIAIEKMREKKGSADYRNSSPMMRRVMSVCVNQDLKNFMPDIKAPTLLIWGENDTATPLSDAKIMEKLIPDAGLVTFAGCGHYSFLENPIGFKAVMKEFFKDSETKK